MPEQFQASFEQIKWALYYEYSIVNNNYDTFASKEITWQQEQAVDQLNSDYMFNSPQLEHLKNTQANLADNNDALMIARSMFLSILIPDQEAYQQQLAYKGEYARHADDIAYLFGYFFCNRQTECQLLNMFDQDYETVPLADLETSISVLNFYFKSEATKDNRDKILGNNLKYNQDYTRIGKNGQSVRKSNFYERRMVFLDLIMQPILDNMFRQARELNFMRRDLETCVSEEERYQEWSDSFDEWKREFDVWRHEEI